MKQEVNQNNPVSELHSAIKAKDLKKVDQLLTGTVVPDKRSLFLAIEQKSHEILKTLIKRGFDVNALEPYWGYTPVVKAIKYEDFEAVKMLLDAGASPNLDSTFERPLIFSAQQGSVEGAKLLIAAGADIEQRNKAKMTPLIVAARRGHAEMVRLLLQAGANPLSVDVLDRTAYDTAVEEKEEEVVKILAPVSSGKIPRPKSPIEQLLDSIKNQDSVAFDKCLADGVDVNKRDKWGWNPLDRAVDVGSAEFVRKLIKAGANINAHKEGTALSMAVNDERADIAEILVKAGAIPRAFSKNGNDPFWTVCIHGDVHLAKLFLEAGADPNSDNDSGETALMKAVGKRGSVELVQLLISKGAEVERADANGWTALFHAVQSNPGVTFVQRKYPSGAKLLAAEPAQRTSEDEQFNEIVSLLLARGANVHRHDKAGRTALTYATSTGMARLLIGAGAKMDIRDKKGHDVNYWLEKNGIAISKNSSPLPSGVKSERPKPVKLRTGRRHV